MEMSAISGQR